MLREIDVKIAQRKTRLYTVIPVYICRRYNLSKLTWTNSATSCFTVRLTRACYGGDEVPGGLLNLIYAVFIFFVRFFRAGGAYITCSLNLHRRRHTHIHIYIAYDRQSQQTTNCSMHAYKLHEHSLRRKAGCTQDDIYTSSIICVYVRVILLS